MDLNGVNGFNGQHPTSMANNKKQQCGQWLSGLTKLSRCLLAVRPWSLSVSFMPVAVGAALAYKSSGIFNPLLFLAVLLTVISVHAAGNLVNTYGDFIRGIDSNRSDDRTLVDRLLTPDEVLNLGTAAYIFGCLACGLVTWLSPAKMWMVALVYVWGLSSSFLYTKGLGLKYIALGDLIVMLTFGPVTVLFSSMAQTGRIDISTVFYAIPLALNTEAIIHSNNTRDAAADRRAGAVTVPILIGPTGSHLLFALLLFVPYIVFAVAAVHRSPWFGLPLMTLPKAFRLEEDFRWSKFDKMPSRTAKLTLWCGVFYLAALMLARPEQLPALGMFV